MDKWWKENRMNINSTKSGILRIKNSLSIPEVENYTYFGITRTQSLKLKDHENKLKKKRISSATKLA